MLKKRKKIMPTFAEVDTIGKKQKADKRNYFFFILAQHLLLFKIKILTKVGVSYG